MALRVSPVSRNLALKVTIMFLEIEDLLALGFACAVAMIAGQFVFSDRYVFSIPMNWFLVLVVVGLGVPGLMLFKYGKPRKYIADLLAWHSKPRSYCALARDTQLKTHYLEERN
jgi:hypothetical protein